MSQSIQGTLGTLVSGSEGLRRRILAASLGLLLFFGLATVFVSQSASLRYEYLVLGWIAALVAIVAAAISYRWFEAGYVTLFFGMVCLIALMALWLGPGTVLVLLAIPVISLVLMAGWRIGALGALGTGAVAVLIGHHMGDPVAGTVAVVLVGSTWVLAVVTLTLAEQLAAWYQADWARSHEQLAEALEQRVELKQAQEDLVHANTELARLTERLNAMRRIAEESRNAKEEFVANVSHELRTPLNMIIGFTEMIAQAPGSYGRLPARLLADIDVILSNSRHLAGLVDDVLDLSQSDVGRMALSRRWVAIDQIIVSAVSAVRPLFESHGLWLKTQVSDGLQAYCDEVRIRQVVVNLLSNAGRFTNEGGAFITARKEGDNVLISVQDTGPGISVEDQTVIFEPFRRVERRTGGSVKGSGLGLAISRRFVEMHGGRMWVESKEGAGSTFSFSLPVDSPGNAADASPEAGRWFSPYHEYDQRHRPLEAPIRNLSPRFVVVEEGTVIQRLLERYQADAEVVGVPTIEEAVALCQRVPALGMVLNHPDVRRLVIASDAWGDLPYGTPVISCWMPDRQQAAEELGVVGYLLKPVSRESLLAAVVDANPSAKTILIVDDEPDAQQLFSRMVSAADKPYRILLASSGSEALELMRLRRPDLVLLDLVMRGMDGYSVLKIKREDPDLGSIPVIAVSAQDPAGGPLPSNFVAAARSGGLYAQDLLDTIRAVTAVLTPPDRLGAPEPQAARRA